jgi:hypothetical protein
VNLEQAAYEEVLRRLLSLRQLASELAEAYDEPVAREGAREMHESIDRVLQLLRHEK